MLMFHLKYFEEVCSYNLESKEFLSLLPQIEVEESLAVNDHKGNEHGLLQVSTLSASSSLVSRILKGCHGQTSGHPVMGTLLKHFHLNCKQLSINSIS